MKAIESLCNAVKTYDEFDFASLDALNVPIEEVIKFNYDYENIKNAIVRWAVIYIHEREGVKNDI